MHSLQGRNSGVNTAKNEIVHVHLLIKTNNSGT